VYVSRWVNWLSGQCLVWVGSQSVMLSAQGLDWSFCVHSDVSSCPTNLPVTVRAPKVDIQKFCMLITLHLCFFSVGTSAFLFNSQ